MVAGWVDRLLAAISPWRCALCLEPALGMDLCTDCLEDLPWLGATCRHCAVPLPDGNELLCGACARAGARRDVDLCVAALAYEFPVDRLVTALKYQHKVEFARVMGELLSIRLHELAGEDHYQWPDCIVPVPLHPLRVLQRGFNQAAEIARWVAREHNLPVKTSLIRRIRHTQGQAGLSRRARSGNVHNAFVINANVSERRIALLDDVVTTAATTAELARLLKRAGAAEVQVWTVARAIQ